MAHLHVRHLSDDVGEGEVDLNGHHVHASKGLHGHGALSDGMPPYPVPTRHKRAFLVSSTRVQVETVVQGERVRRGVRESRDEGSVFAPLCCIALERCGSESGIQRGI